MEKIQFDSGIQEYRLGGPGVLRFNPGDPNVYARFLEAGDKVRQVEEEMLSRMKENGEAEGAVIIRLLKEADQKLKTILSWIFGPDNDFDKILGGVNLLAVGANGKRVVLNLFDALQPVLLSGAERCAQEKVQGAVKKARARRENQ